MKSLTKLPIGIIILSLFAFVACKQSAEKPATADTESMTEGEIKETIEEAAFPMPEPLSFYQTLSDIGAVYTSSILNPVSNNDNYFTQSSKAAALGVYGADLAYATVYDAKSDVNSYSRVLKSITDDMSLKVDLAYLLEDETQEMMKDRDSLISITTKVFYDTYSFLNKNSDPSLAALMANGFYIEGLYIATHIMEDAHEDFNMVKLIYDQSTVLEKLIDINSKFEGNDYLESIQGALKKLKSQYDATDGSLNKEQLDEITKTIEAIRDSLVS